MRHHTPIAATGILAFGLLAALPACAQEEGDRQEIIGPPPAVDCCWGYAPTLASGVAVASAGDWLLHDRKV